MNRHRIIPAATGNWAKIIYQRDAITLDIRRLDIIKVSYYYIRVIKTFASKETEKIWNGEVSRRLPGEIQNIARRKLRILNNSFSLNDLFSPPGNKLEKLTGDRKGQHSIRINDQWRICFKWAGNDCYDVEIVDYH